MATFTVSLGARRARPSTRLGTINGAPAATIAPSVAPVPATNSRRVRSFLFVMSRLLSRLPFALCHRRNKSIQAARRERERLALLGALVGRHQEFDDFQTVVKRQQRLFLAEKHAREVPVFVLIAVNGSFIRDDRHQSGFRVLLLEKILACLALHGARKEEL